LLVPFLHCEKHPAERVVAPDLTGFIAPGPVHPCPGRGAVQWRAAGLLAIEPANSQRVHRGNPKDEGPNRQTHGRFPEAGRPAIGEEHGRSVATPLGGVPPGPALMTARSPHRRYVVVALSA